MFQDGPVNRIDEIIHKIRREISKIAEDFNSTTDDLIDFLSVSNREAYNSILDSLYLLEDILNLQNMPSLKNHCHARSSEGYIYYITEFLIHAICSNKPY